jgi:hypothetical protein
MSLVGGAVTTLVCTIALTGCSHISSRSAYVSRSVLNSHVLLVPDLQGGWAGWSLATGHQAMVEGVGPLRRTSSGPIFAEGSCVQNKSRIDVYAVTESDVAAVSVAGGMPVPTTTNSTLPDGLRAAAVEVLRRNGEPNSGLSCPHITPLDSHDRPIRSGSKPSGPQAFILPGTRLWEAPARPPAGVCELVATHFRRSVAEYGYVATRIRPYRGLIGKALLSCISTVYLYHGDHYLTAAVLLSASAPGATPPPLPGMKPVPGSTRIFEAPGAEGELAMRRIPGAWLVVEEQDRIGLSVPVELLGSLRATVHL